MCVFREACSCALLLMSHGIVRMALSVATAHDARAVRKACGMAQWLGVGSSSEGMGVACKALVKRFMCTWQVRLMCHTHAELLQWTWGGLCAAGAN